MRRFNKKKRVTALLAAALLIVCLPAAALGDETATPEPTQTPTQEPEETTVEPTVEPVETATPEPEETTMEPTVEPTEPTTAEPTEAPQGSPQFTEGPSYDGMPTTPDESVVPDGPTTPDGSTPETPTTPDGPTTPDDPTTPDESTTPEQSETPFEPKGEAWIELTGGGYLDGSLNDMVHAVLNNEGPGPVHVRAAGSFPVYDVTVDTLLYGVAIMAPGCELAYLSSETGCTVCVTGNVNSGDSETGPDGISPLALDPPETLHVTLEGFEENTWMNTPTVFLLSSEPAMSEAYMFVVILDGERVINLDKRTSYVPPEGKHQLRFQIMGRNTDELIVDGEENYTAMWDVTPPETLTIEGTSDTQCVIRAHDATSGVADISFDGGKTWQPFDEKSGYTLNGTSDSALWPDSVVVRDRAGNMTAYDEWYEFAAGKQETTVRAGGGGGGTPAVHHVRETADYSLANYNALELDFSSEPAEELIAGDTVLPVSLTSETGDQTSAGLFTAHLESWQVDEEDERTTPNALVLTADGQSDVNTWSFSGEAYRLLYNSGIDYLVFESDGYMTAVSTAGFTAGTTYARLKAGGTSTKKFFYTINQDESLRETTLCVEVEGMTYVLGEAKDQPMYRYDVVIGSTEMMDEPFRSYLPETDEGGAAIKTYPLVLPGAQGNAAAQPDAQAADDAQNLPDVLIFG